MNKPRLFDIKSNDQLESDDPMEKGQGETHQKQAKYYSNQDYYGTVRKRLINEYADKQKESPDEAFPHKDKQGGISTHYTQSQQENTNNALLNQLENSIHSYQSQLKVTTPLQKIKFTQTDFRPKQLESKYQQLKTVVQEQPASVRVQSRLDQELKLKQAEELISDLLPKRKTSHIDKQISALYKENRNINLEYRRNKFMQIFTGTDRFAPKFSGPY